VQLVFPVLLLTNLMRWSLVGLQKGSNISESVSNQGQAYMVLDRPSRESARSAYGLEQSRSYSNSKVILIPFFSPSVKMRG